MHKAFQVRRITLALLTHNRTTALIRLLRSLVENRVLVSSPVPVEVLLLDNGSTVSLDSVRQAFRECAVRFGFTFRYLRSEENLGCAQGRNILMREASGDCIVFIDDDTEIRDPHFFAAFVDAFHRIERLGIYAFPVYEPGSATLFIPHKRKAWRRQPAFFTYIMWGSAHAIRRDLAQHIGGYSPVIGDRGEEYDLAFKVLQAGYRIWYEARTFVLHFPERYRRAPARKRYIDQAVHRILIAWRFLPWRFVLTHAILWSLFAVVRTRSLTALVQVWRQVLQKKRNYPRTPLTGWARRYLKEVHARLLY